MLTVDGERIAALGSRMENEACAVSRAAKAGQQAIAGEIAISAPPAMATALIAPRLAQLRQQYPGIHIRLIGETRMASLHREADLAIRLSRPTEAELVTRKIGVVAFSLYASPAYLDLHSSENFEFIAYDDSMEDSAQQRWLRKNAGTRPIVLRTNNLETQKAAARASMGIAALPYFLGDKDDGLQRLESDEEELTRDVWLAVHGDLRNTPAVRATMDFLIGCFPQA